MCSWSPHPVLLVLFLIVSSYILNALIPSVLTELIWKIYTSLLPTALSHKLKEQKQLKLDILRLRNEIQGTSAQDQFAKWVKAKRKHDEKMAKLENLSLELNTARTKFFTHARVINWIFPHATKIIVSLYYLKTPMFYLPTGLIPGYIEFLLAYPFAPKGAVSVHVWVWACGIVVDLLGTTIVESVKWVGKKLGRKELEFAEAQTVLGKE